MHFSVLFSFHHILYLKRKIFFFPLIYSSISILFSLREGNFIHCGNVSYSPLVINTNKAKDKTYRINDRYQPMRFPERVLKANDP